ncbi:MAG: nucleotidyltransferase family protein [Cyclobacteriaceae bacterium]|nr:nucleotidyltransferase family protein [Cyclobacteriaceae bacterium]
MLTKSEIISKLKELKLALYKDYAVKNIGLFGSFSVGDSTEYSDIDLLVEFEKPIGWKYFTLELYLEKIFGRKIDLVTENALKEQIRGTIMKQVDFV